MFNYAVKYNKTVTVLHAVKRNYTDTELHAKKFIQKNETPSHFKRGFNILYLRSLFSEPYELQ